MKRLVTHNQKTKEEKYGIIIKVKKVFIYSAKHKIISLKKKYPTNIILHVEFLCEMKNKIKSVLHYNNKVRYNNNQ